VKREERIFIRVTPAEKEIIESASETQGTNVSKMLRFLGLHADKFSTALKSLRELTSWLNHLKLIASSPDIETKPEDIQAAVNNAIKPIQSLEEALSLPRQIENPNPDL
jgi:hypothetical protein